MGVRGIARWSNAPADGLDQVRESIRGHHEAKILEPWTAHLRTVRRGQVTNVDGTHASERLMWEYIHTAGDMLVIIDDPSAPKRAEFSANLVEIRAANVSKPEQERQPEPHVPLHYRTTMITVDRPTIDMALTQLGGAWHLNPPRPQQGSGRPQQGIVHRAKISGELWQVGKDWHVRIGSVLGMNETFKGIIMEIEYLPVAILPAEFGSSVFLDSFTMSLLPSLPAEALFNSVTLGDEEWMDLCGLDYSSDADGADVDVYVYGDNPNEKENRTKDDWRRSAYLIVQCLKGEGLL